MNIIQALKNTDVHDIRVTHGGRWLYWSSVGHEWIVRGQPHPHMRDRILLVTEDEAKAVAMLLGQEPTK